MKSSEGYVIPGRCAVVLFAFTYLIAGNLPGGENPEITELTGEAEEDGWL